MDSAEPEEPFQARTQEDFEKWKERMKAGGAPPLEKIETAVASPPPEEKASSKRVVSAEPDDSMDKFLGKQVIAQVLDSGFILDFIDADAIDSVGIPYRVLILPGVDRLPVATYEKILDFARRGGIVIATRWLPASAPGLIHAEEDTAAVCAVLETMAKVKRKKGRGASRR